MVQGRFKSLHSFKKINIVPYNAERLIYGIILIVLTDVDQNVRLAVVGNLLTWLT